jgi:hypothetical protein
MLFLAFTYTKMSRVEAMYSLYGNNINEERILLEGSAETKPSMMPQFYADSWDCEFTDRIEPTQIPLVAEGANYDYIFFFGACRNLMGNKSCKPSTGAPCIKYYSSKNNFRHREITQDYAVPRQAYRIVYA